MIYSRCPDGMGPESIHLDKFGNYNDGDQSVYVHENDKSSKVYNPDLYIFPSFVGLNQTVGMQFLTLLMRFKGSKKENIDSKVENLLKSKYE